MKFISGFEVMVSTEKDCKRCHGKGIGTWGMTYGECFRCGGFGKETKVDVAATMAGFVTILARIEAEGKAAKAALAVATDVLHKGNARRSYERAQRQYKEVLEARKRVIEHHKVKGA